MKIYLYDKNTNIFLSESTAQKNPKRPGEFLFPKNSTIICPPAVRQNQAAVFNGVSWDIVDDYRGELQINKITKEVSEITETGRLSENFILYSEYLKSDEYKAELKEQELEAKRAEICDKMNIIDKKRIRAACEPSVRDNLTGETWLEYYNKKMAELRQQLLEVRNVD
ncbi:MAG: hypothetical protein K6E29_00130 [Cyanobacteria bacterium RUI128]|nr:hypothetical protein [Cyanobacteria bacterium RUI128]